MSQEKRKNILMAVEEELLFRCNHTCAICRNEGKDIQIHHIDGNHNNNNIKNLIAVCLDCHSRVSGSRGLGKSYRPGEVRRYKLAWEKQVEDSHRVHRPQIRYQKELITQIDLIICEILALKAPNPRIGLLFGVLHELQLWRGTREINRKLLEGMDHLALMTGLGAPQVGPLVADFLWKLCWHFVDPEWVPMDKVDIRFVIDCIDALETLAKFNCEFGKGRRTVVAVSQSAEQFLDIGIWYQKKSIIKKVISTYTKALASCKADGKVEFKYGHVVITRSIKRVIDTLGQEKPKFEAWQAKFQALLKADSNA
jgi:hypothetical protein